MFLFIHHVAGAGLFSSLQHLVASASKQIFYPSTNVLIQRPKNCSWSINVPEDRVVVLEIIALSLSNQSSLKVYDGPDADSDAQGKIISSKHDTIESSGRNIHLAYTSTLDNGIDYFKIGYKQSGEIILINGCHIFLYFL